MINKKESDLGNLLLLFRRRIIESLKKEGPKEELTFSQFEVLCLIGPKGRETMRSIDDYLKVTPPSATEIVSEMEKKGLVVRKGDEADRRVVHIAPTARAKKLLVSVSKRKEAVLRKMLSK